MILMLQDFHDVSNQQQLDCLLNRLFSLVSKKTSKYHITGFCEGRNLMTDGFPSQRVSHVDSVSMSWYLHGSSKQKANDMGQVKDLWLFVYMCHHQTVYLGQLCGKLCETNIRHKGHVSYYVLCGAGAWHNLGLKNNSGLIYQNYSFIFAKFKRYHGDWQFLIVSGWLSLMAFLGTADMEVLIIHVITTYMLASSSSLKYSIFYENVTLKTWYKKILRRLIQHDKGLVYLLAWWRHMVT